MIGYLQTRVRKQPIIALYFESENEHRFYNLETWLPHLNCLPDVHLNKLISEHFTNSLFLTKAPIILNDFLT